jgi:hypothetical protein
LWEHLKGRNHLEILGVSGRIILNCVLKNRIGELRLDAYVKNTLIKIMVSGKKGI